MSSTLKEINRLAKLNSKKAAVETKERNIARNKIRDAKIKEIEDRMMHFEEVVLPQLKLIRNTCYYYQNRFPTRGKCVCVWEGSVYIVINNKAIISDKLISSDLPKLEKDKIIECVKEYPDGKKYYLLFEDVAKSEILIHEWVNDSYEDGNKDCEEFTEEEIAIIDYVESEEENYFPDRVEAD